MEYKKYVRRGIFNECLSYKPLIKYDGQKPDNIIMLLEGKCRRKIKLVNNRYLYENYYPTSFIGLEDFILNQPRTGITGMYPGSHYVIWNGEDFMNAVGIQPELARRSIYELCRRIRIYDSHKKSTDALLKVERTIDIGPPQAELADTIYEMSFSDEDEFPPHLVDKLSQTFQADDYLMRQGELTSELYIILSGRIEIVQKKLDGSSSKNLGILKEGDMVGEMAQFDALPRSADAIALDEVVALVFRPENFHMLFQLHPKWSQKLMHTLAERINFRLQGFSTMDLEELKT